jgi:pyruvate/2-oxoglutarate dehydrogenase complex dihydrolipoamide acyltransferase (E2) component
MKSEFLPKHRRPTFFFLDFFDNRSTVHLFTTVDMGRVITHRESVQTERAQKPSYVSYVVWAAARALRRFPEANAAFHGNPLLPRIVYYDRVAAKVTFDKTVNGRKVVVSQLIHDVDRKTLGQIQERVTYFRDTPEDRLPEMKPYFMLQKLPVLLGKLATRGVFRDAKRRFEAQGSFTVTSLGHSDVVDFYPVISTGTCFAMGAIRDTPVVQDKEIVVRPMMPLSFSFDHRLLDGAAAADLLSATKHGLESFSEKA